MMVFDERSLSVLTSTHEPFVKFSLRCQLQRGVSEWLLWVAIFEYLVSGQHPPLTQIFGI